MGKQRSKDNYPVVIVDGKTYHVCPLEYGAYVLLAPEVFDTPWWRCNPWVDTHVDTDVEPPKILGLPTC